MKGQGTSGTSTGLMFSCQMDVSFVALDSRVIPQSVPGCHCLLKLTHWFADKRATFVHDCACLDGFLSNFDDTADNVTMADFTSRVATW